MAVAFLDFEQPIAELEVIPRDELKVARATKIAAFGVFSESAP